MSDKEDKGRGPVWLGVASAVGGAVLTLGVQATVAMLSENRAEVRKTREAEAAQTAAAADARVARLNQHYTTYEGLGDLPRRARAFIDSGNEGNAADVRDVVRRLRALVDDVAMRRIDPAATSRYFGGRLRGWASSLRAIGNSTSLRFRLFSADERAYYLNLADAIELIVEGHELPPDVIANRVSEVTADTNAANAY